MNLEPKTKKYIQDYTRRCSNKLISVVDRNGEEVISYHEWITPQDTLPPVGQMDAERKIQRLGIIRHTHGKIRQVRQHNRHKPEHRSDGERACSFPRLQETARGAGTENGRETASGKGGGGMLNFNITPDTYKELSDTLSTLKDISNGGNIAVQYSALYSGALEHLYHEGVEQATEFKNEFAPEDVVLFSKLLGVSKANASVFSIYSKK